MFVFKSNLIISDWVIFVLVRIFENFFHFYLLHCYISYWFVAWFNDWLITWHITEIFDILSLSKLYFVILYWLFKIQMNVVVNNKFFMKQFLVCDLATGDFDLWIYSLWKSLRDDKLVYVFCSKGEEDATDCAQVPQQSYATEAFYFAQ